MRRLLAVILGIAIMFFGYSFAWHSGEFLDKDFWDGDEVVRDDEYIYLALFGNSAYTDIRNGYDLTSCSIENIITTSELSGSLRENTIYILTTGFISVKETINIGNCTAIVSKTGTTIKNEVVNGDAFLFKGHFSILDNINIYGDKQGSGIVIDNTHSITINNISLKTLTEGIFSNKSDYITYNNIHILDIGDYAFLVSNSKYNKISNLFSYDNEREGLLIEGGGSNILSGINCYDNVGAGVYIDSSTNNKLYNIYSYNNKQGIWLYDNSNNNEIYNSVITGNNQGGLVISSNNNKIKNIYINKNREGVAIYGENNDLSTLYIFNNKTQGILVMTGKNNTINGGFIYNNSSHGILLYNASNNTFVNIQNFNNGQIISGSSRCGIMLYGNSNNNYFKDTSIYNNLIGVCFESNGYIISNNTFEDMKILNNKKNESHNGKSTGNIFSGTITTFILTKTGNLGETTGKTNKTGIQVDLIGLKTGDKISVSGFNVIKTGNLLIQRVVEPSFEYMINPHVDNVYLYSWKSKYSDIIGHNSGFLSIKDKRPKYSIGIMIQNEITGHIISNGKNVVADGQIDSFEIGKNIYKGNRIKYPLNISTGNVRNIVATNINDKDIHAMLILDTKAPTCEIEYSTTGKTTENVIATLTGCSEEIAGTDLTYPFTKNGTYTFEFTDLVGNSGSAEANVSRIKPKPSGNGGGGGGGGGGGSVNNETSSTTTNSGNSNSKFTFNTGKFDPDYSEEMNMAYQYAYHYKITTQKSISEAGMDHGLTRIAMAKMLSMYAINVLGKKPANVIIPEFFDVSNELDDQYDNGLTLAYQLGIMGINIPNNEFRPYDLVTRAEFATALSRLLYGTVDGTDTYYSTHLNKLLEKGIIRNINPDLQELRGYVMIMLMRSALGINSVEDFVYPEPEPQEQEIVKYFTEPYKKGQIYSRIGDLQDLLRYLGYYKYGTNYVYSRATINAVYDFQVAIGLIDAEDIYNPAKGYLGPETRNALNEKWAEFQQYKNGIANE